MVLPALEPGGEPLGQQTAGTKCKVRVGFNGSREPGIGCVHGPDESGGRALKRDRGNTSPSNLSQKEILKSCLIMPVGFQILGEAFVMGKGKGIQGIVDEFAQTVAVPGGQVRFPIQPEGQAHHIPAGVAVVMPPEPAAAQGAFDVGGRIFIRLGAAEKKSLGAGFRQTGQVFTKQNPSHQGVAFISHRRLLILYTILS